MLINRRDPFQLLGVDRVGRSYAEEDLKLVTSLLSRGGAYAPDSEQETASGGDTSNPDTGDTSNPDTGDTSGDSTHTEPEATPTAGT